MTKSQEEFDYTFKIPMLKRSTKPIYIRDKNLNEVGILKKYYSSIGDRLADQVASLVNKTNYRISLTDSENTCNSVCAKLKKTLFREKWTFFLNDNKKIGSLINKTNISTNIRYIYSREKEKDTYEIKSDFLDRNVYIYDNDGIIVARVFYTKMISRDYYIKVNIIDLLSLEEIILLTINTLPKEN